MSRFETKLTIRASIIRETTVLANGYKAVDLGQGFPSSRPGIDACSRAISGILAGNRVEAEFLLKKPIDSQANFESLLKSLPSAEDDSLNQYTHPRGTNELREAVSNYYERLYNCHVDPEKEITITLGSTEAISVALRTLIPPLHGVIIFQPFHEMYINQSYIFHIKPIIIPLHFSKDENSKSASEKWSLHLDDLEEAFSTSTYPIKGLILNTPHNPTGKVFTKEELKGICDFCVSHKIWLIKDDVYEHIIYKKKEEKENLLSQKITSPHIMLWNWDHLKCRNFVVIISSISKMATATGWRVGWILSSKNLSQKIACIHDNIAMQAPTVFQYASEIVLRQPLKFFVYDIAESFEIKYKILEQGLKESGFDFCTPQGTYYVLATYSNIPTLAQLTAEDASKYLIKNVGVAAVPGNAFFDYDLLPEDQPKNFLRFAFCKSDNLINEAIKRLIQWKNNHYQPIQ